eukprot:scaffold528691_cov59-Attheya_sp.AAC.1
MASSLYHLRRVSRTEFLHSSSSLGAYSSCIHRSTRLLGGQNNSIRCMASLNNVSTTAPANLQEVATRNARRFLWDKPAIAGLVMMGVTAASLMTLPSATSLEAAPVEDTAETESDDENETTTVINWSGTHSIEVPNKSYFEPESIEDLEKIVKRCHETSIPIRPVGSALSPNGIAFMEGGM